MIFRTLSIICTQGKITLFVRLEALDMTWKYECIQICIQTLIDFDDMKGNHEKGKTDYVCTHNVESFVTPTCAIKTCFFFKHKPNQKFFGYYVYMCDITCMPFVSYVHCKF